jgi:hypothetical protein
VRGKKVSTFMGDSGIAKPIAWTGTNIVEESQSRYANNVIAVQYMAVR